jgi:hypothetical protein
VSFYAVHEVLTASHESTSCVFCGVCSLFLCVCLCGEGGGRHLPSTQPLLPFASPIALHAPTGEGKGKIVQNALIEVIRFGTGYRLQQEDITFDSLEKLAGESVWLSFSFVSLRPSSTEHASSHLYVAPVERRS